MCIPYDTKDSIMSSSAHNQPPDEDASKPKRSSGDVRKDHLSKGAHLIEFATPGAPRDMIRHPVAPGLRPTPSFEGESHKTVVSEYRTMERKGFRVTRDIGCLIADDQYGIAGQGATVKGHQRTFSFFAGWRPRASGFTTNQFGWPSNLEISHLCHRHGCCRIDHMVAEEKWRNQKRNYCGSNGSCDCGNPVKCLRTYTTAEQNLDLCTTREEIVPLLAGCPSYQIHGNDRQDNRDKKSQQWADNKRKRKRRQDRHAHQTARKQARHIG